MKRADSEAISLATAEIASRGKPEAARSPTGPLARSQKNVRQPNGRDEYTMHRPSSPSKAQRRSPATGSVRRFGIPPRARTARSSSASSTAVGYGSRPVTPKRQQSVLASQRQPSSSASTLA
jgi:hypothetical protein